MNGSIELNAECSQAVFETREMHSPTEETEPSISKIPAI